jgi:RNA polymerase sigma factor (sigma-70 family)
MRVSAQKERVVEMVVKLLVPIIHRHLYYLLNDVTLQTLEEMTWWAAYLATEAIPNYDPSKATFITFAKTIARNYAIGVLRKHNVITIDIDSLSERESLDDGFEKITLLKIEREELRERIHEWLKTKPPDYEAIFDLWLDGLTPKEIAQIVTHRNQKQIQDILVAIKRSLRALIDHSGGSP